LHIEEHPQECAYASGIDRMVNRSRIKANYKGDLP